MKIFRLVRDVVVNISLGLVPVLLGHEDLGVGQRLRLDDRLERRLDVVL